VQDLESSVDAILATLGIYKISVLLAGGIGGTVSLKHYQASTIRNRCLIVLSSVALANYLTPPCIAYFGQEAVNFELGIALGVGLFGMSIISSITVIIQDTTYWKRFLAATFNRNKAP
jgi:hypothetical protein